MKMRRNRNFTAYQQTLFNKYEIDEGYLQTRKQRRACLELLEKVDKNQVGNEKKLIEKITEAFRDSELYKKVGSCVTITALLVVLQSSPVMAQASYGFSSSAGMIESSEPLENNRIIMDEDSSLNINNVVVQEEMKTTSIHLVANQVMKNDYEPLSKQGVILDEDSSVVYYPNQELKALTVIDTSIEDWELLRDGVKNGEILLLNSEEDPLDLIIAKLEEMKEIDCLNIISHGSSGRLHFENGVITEDALAKNQEQWQKIASYLDQEADIQLFGCNVAKGEEGKAFINTLAKITGADIAASINPTGNKEKGGDWKLEAVIGDVNGNLPFTEKAISQFMHILLPTGLIDFSTFTDIGSTLRNDFFTVSGLSDSTSLAVDRSGNSAFINSENQWFEFIVTADGSNLKSFELEGFNLSTSQYGFSLGASGHTTDGRTISTGYVPYTGSYYSPDITYTQTIFSNWSIFNNEQLDSFKIYCDHGMFGSRFLNFNSFTISNPTSGNASPVLGGTFLTNGAINDRTTITPFSGVTISDGDDDNVSINITYTGANGALSSLSGGLTKNSTGNYTLDSDSVANIISKLQALVFTPAQNQVAPGATIDTIFNLTPNDGTVNGTANNTTKITVTSVNDVPVASSATFTTNEDTAITDGTLVGSATDPDPGDPLTYELKAGSTTAHGTLTLNADGTFTYTPAANYNGTDSFTWKAKDQSGTYSNEASATITIEPVNDSPTAGDYLKNGWEDTVMNLSEADFNGVATYSDIDSDTLSGIQIVSLPDSTHGILKLNGVNITTGQSITLANISNMTFVPALNYNGYDETSFTWKAYDGTAYSDTAATFEINIHAIVDRPVIADSTKPGTEDTVMTFTPSDFLNNYSDGDNDALGNIQIITAPEPEEGVLKLSGAAITLASSIDAADLGNITFVPATNFFGNTSFTWQAEDVTGQLTEIPATMTLSLTGVNDGPVATSNTVTSDEDTAYTGTLAGNVTDPDASDALTYSKVSDPSHGTVTVNGNGSFTYTPEAEYAGTDSFTWKVNDGTADSNVATLTVNVTSVNDAPAITAPASITVFEDTTGAIIGMSFADADAAASLVDVAVSVNSGTLSATSGGGVTVSGSGTAALNLNGTIAAINSFVAGSNILYTTAANSTADVTLDVTINDNGSTGSGGSLTDAAQTTLEITGVNDAPTVTNSAKNGTEDTTMTFTAAEFSSVFSDIDADSLSKIKILTLPDATQGLLKLNGIDITQDQEIGAGQLANITFVPALNYNGTATFTWNGSDGTLYAATGATMTLSLSLVNDLPVITNSTKSGTEDTTITFTAADFNGAAVYTDTENNALGKVKLITLPNAAQGSLKLNGVDVTVNQEITADQLANFTFVPASNFNGTTSFTWKANDGTDYSASAATMTISIAAINDAPAAIEDTETTNEDTAYTGTLVGNATDPDAGYSLTYSKDSDPSHGIVTVNGDGSFTYTPEANYTGTDSFTWKANDGTADSNTATLTVNITPVNDGPAITAPATINVTEDIASTITGISFADIDAATGNVAVTLGASSGTLSSVSGGNVTVTGSGTATLVLNGTIANINSFVASSNVSFATAENRTTNVTLNIAINDNGNTGSGGSLTDTAQTTLTVTPVNDLPLVTNSTKNGTEDTTITFTAADFNGQFSDVEGDALNKIKILTLPNVVYGVLKLNGTDIVVDQEIDAADLGNITFVPGLNFNGTKSFTWKANDGTGYSSTAATMTLSIAAVNDAPVANNSTWTVNEDSVEEIDLAQFISDVDGDSLECTIVSGPSHGQVAMPNFYNNVVAYRSDPDYNGLDSFQWRVTDGSLLSEIVTMTITVTSRNDAPAITAPTNINVIEDAASAISGISFADVDAATGTVTVTLGVGSGTLTATSGGGITVNGSGTATLVLEGSVADINSFISNDNVMFMTVENSINATTIDVTIDDNGNTGSGGNQIRTVQKTLSVIPVNDLPTVANSTKNGTEEITMTFTAADFSGVFSDVDGDSLSKIKILTLPDAAHGVLKINGVDVTVNQEITAGQLANITFVPALNFNGTATFTWKGSDGSDYSASSATTNISIAAVIDVPDSPTNVTATPGNTIAIISFTTPADDGGSTITQYTVNVYQSGTLISGLSSTGLNSPITVSGLTNGAIYTFKVTATNIAGISAESLESNTATPYRSSTSSGGTTTTLPTDNGVDILINGKAETAGTSLTTERGTQTVTTILVDEQKLEQRLEGESNQAVVTIMNQNNSDISISELNGQMIKNMENKEATLEVKTSNATYSLPAQQLDIESISGQLGSPSSLQDIKVQIEMTKASGETATIVENAAKQGEFTIVAPSMEFNVSCSYGGKTVEVKNFKAYVERTIAIPEGVDPNKITTGIIVEADGTVRHVPTKITVIDGTYYAVINSLTNSVYSVVWHPLAFQDVVSHWAKDAVNDMGSRMVISGVGNDRFDPGRDISRAEFSAIVVRALGLQVQAGKGLFVDVKANEWYAPYIETAYEYGITTGYGNDKFGPMDKITREQAMTMIARAMKITGLEVDFEENEVTKLLSAFVDASASESWAEKSIAACIQSGIISGKEGKKLAAKDNITRAEVAVIIQKLLKKSDLI